MSEPSVVILAGGENSRFFPFDVDIRKTGMILMGEPFVLRTLKNLVSAGFHHVVFVYNPQEGDTGGIKDLIQQTNLDLDVDWVKQPEAKGMGHALSLAQEFLRSSRFAVISPYHFQIGQTLREMMAQPTEIVLCATPTEEPWNYGILEVENNLLVGIVEKPAPGREPSNLKVQTAYLLNRDFLNSLADQADDQYNFEATLDVLAKQELITVYDLTSPLLTLKYPWHLFAFQDSLFQTLKSSRSPEADISHTAVIDDSQGPVVISKGALIKDFAKIVGPAFIGEDVLIGEYSFIRESSVEKNSTVGAYTEIVRSIIMLNSSLHQSYVADSIIGSHNHVGAGLITANRRLDRGSIPVEVKGKKVDSGRTRLGVMTGPHSNIGIQIATMPGICIGAHTSIFPGQTLYQNVPHQQEVKA